MEFIPIEQAHLVATTKYESCYVYDSDELGARTPFPPLYAPTSSFEIKGEGEPLPLSFEQTFFHLFIPFFFFPLSYLGLRSFSSLIYA